MTVLLGKFDIAYFPVPKTACTSLKYLMYKINFGKNFEMHEVDGEVKHIHNSMYPTPLFQDLNPNEYKNHTRIAVIREPVARMLSAFSNRVGFHGELSENAIDTDLAARLGVQPNPSADHFFNNIEKFRVLSGAIRHHTDPTSAFLGPDLSYYHHVFQIEHLSELVSFLEQATGRPVELDRRQVGGEKIHFKDLGQRAQKNLMQFCYGDYALMRGYYDHS